MKNAGKNEEGAKETPRHFSKKDGSIGMFASITN